MTDVPRPRFPGEDRVQNLAGKAAELMGGTTILFLGGVAAGAEALGDLAERAEKEIRSAGDKAHQIAVMAGIEVERQRHPQYPPQDPSKKRQRPDTRPGELARPKLSGQVIDMFGFGGRVAGIIIGREPSTTKKPNLPNGD